MSVRLFTFFLAASFAHFRVSAQNRSDSLLVFVGEKIDVHYSPEKPKVHPPEKAVIGENAVLLPRLPRAVDVPFDGRYAATYKIISTLHGSYTKDTIKFIAFDHYGMPEFSQFKNILLFVSSCRGKLYHEKYQYFALYATEDGKWASPYSSSDYEHPYKNSLTMKPQRIRFKYDLSFPLEGLASDVIAKRYPKPYYELRVGSAIAIYGKYADELFKLKQQTVLKARGIF